jgi:hypothetical protein
MTNKIERSRKLNCVVLRTSQYTLNPGQSVGVDVRSVTQRPDDFSAAFEIWFRSSSSNALNSSNGWLMSVSPA